jgi:hypothetical protein
MNLIAHVSNGLRSLIVIGFMMLLSPLNAANGESLHDANNAAFFASINGLSNSSSPTVPLVNKRVEVLSAVLLNTPYMDGSLGEGSQGKYDKDPLVRFDLFDCTTYVETVLAGALSQSSGEFMTQLLKLRYKNGEVSFTLRNHFPSIDWIPNNQANLLDITHLIAGDSLAYAHTIIDKPSWYKNLRKTRLKCSDANSVDCDNLLEQMRSEGDGFSAQAVSTPYVPLTSLYRNNGTLVNQALLDRIPSGSVINMVRPDWPIKALIGTNMNISHQGIAIRNDGKLYIRHASLENLKVMDVGFVDYFARYSETSSLKGFNVLELQL